MRKIRGVSLLEIVIAMQCTAILLIMTCQALPLARRQLKEADLSLGGALLAQSVLEHHLTVPIKDWPKEPLSFEGEGRKVQIEALRWSLDPRMTLARVTVLVGADVQYRLETLVAP